VLKKILYIKKKPSHLKTIPVLGNQFLDQDDKVQPEVKPDAATDLNIFIQGSAAFLSRERLPGKY